MATYKSIVELNGKIGDLVFYTLNGKPVVRRKSGFSKEGFRENPNYRKVLQNSTEFGHCSKSGKLLRLEIQKYIGDCGDKYLYQKFAKVMTQIKDLDTQSEKGKRNIEIGLQHLEAVELLKNFKFGNYETLNQMVISGNAMFTKNFVIAQHTSINTAQLLTIKPDFTHLIIETIEQSLPVTKNRNLDFDYQFEQSPLLLYFLILKKNNDILFAGFVD